MCKINKKLWYIIPLFVFLIFLLCYVLGGGLHVDNRDFIVKHNNKYYVNEEKFLELVDLANSQNETLNATNWQTAYTSFLGDFPAPKDNESFYFSLRDLDGDGVPELIIYRMNNATFTKDLKDLVVYSYENSVYKIGEFENAGSYASELRTTDNPMFRGLFLLWYGGGMERYGYLYVEDGELKYEYLFYYDYTAEQPNKEIVSDNEEAVHAFPRYDCGDNILEMYDLEDFDAFEAFLLDANDTVAPRATQDIMVLDYLGECLDNEFRAYSDWLQLQSNGEVVLYVDVSPRVVEGLSDYYTDNFYAVYVGESWYDRTIRWDWFYVGENLDIILWENIVTEEFLTLDEWRESPHYRSYMGNTDTVIYGIRINPAVDNDNLSPMAFGYASIEGSRLVLLNSQEATHGNPPHSFDYAVGENGQIYQIEYSNYQEGNDSDNLRENMWNLDNAAGHIYNVLEATATPNDTYMLLTKHEYEGIIVYTPENGINQSVANELLEASEELSGREVNNSWLLSEYQNDTRISILEFDNKDNDLLAWLVLEQGGTFKYCEFAAQLDNHGNGWRLGDNGVLHEMYFSVLCAIQREHEAIIYLIWHGYETDVVYEIRFENADVISSVVAGRYIAPV